MTSPTTVTLSASIPVESSNLTAASNLSELAQSVKEKGLWIFGESDSKRRVIKIEKRDGSYGFTLQSYGVRYKHGNRETDFITYVNAVEKDGAAYHAGLREGDVILSINGQNMARVEHKSLVAFIRQCPTHLKMLVISDERARKVELHMRFVHLQKKLQDKMKELEQLNKAEKEILLGTFDAKSMDLPGSSCFGGDDSTACCFCPGKPKSFLDDKEKSKSMNSSKSGRHQKSDHLYYDCYRKSQSTKELHTTNGSNAGDPITGVGSIVGIQSAKKTQSGGELSSLSSPYGVGPGLFPGQSSTTSSIVGGNGTGRCHHGHGSSTSNQSKPPTPSPAGGGENNSKPKSWDNLMTTKSFGGYGFGFGYSGGLAKGPTNHSHGGHHHFSHPHHHNHHTHCSNHPHYSYYYNPNNPKSSGSGVPRAGSSRRTSIDSSGCPSKGQGGQIGGGESSTSSRPFTNYTTYKMVGTTRVVARVTMGNIETSSTGGSISTTRTLPSGRSSSSSRSCQPTPDTLSNYSGKLEKTLSDSSLNSERHKDFPKSMSYFSKSSDNDGNYSSDDDYDEYATEKSLGPKNDIYV